MKEARKMLLTFPFLISLTYAACTRPKTHHKPPPKHHLPQHPPQLKRDPQIDNAQDLSITTGPSPISIDLPAAWLPPAPIQILPPGPILPPPWSPNANIDSPYPSSGVSPWDDSGRSQMVDNIPLSSWKSCPAKRLDCNRCPGDIRCRRYPDPISSSSPSSSATPTSSSSPTPNAKEDDTAPETTGNENCPFLPCSTTIPFLACGANARCTRGFCVCDLGFKGNWRHGVGARGTEGLGTLTVYQDPGVDCDVKCDTLGCKEVDQVDVGQCWKDDSEEERKERKKERVDQLVEGVGPGELDTDSVVSGAVNLPGADFVEGVADGGSVGEAT